MKKLRLLTFAFVVFLFAGFVRINAIYVDEVEFPGSNVTQEKQADGSYKLTLTGDAEQDLIIRDGEVVTLDLNGHTLINFTDACEAIKVLSGGKLTITDSVGNGKVTQKSSSTYSTITNLGTLIIEGGSFETNLNFYVIRNEASLTISGGNFSSTSLNTSLIGNIQYENTSVTPTLTISDGTFSANQNTIRNNENSIVNISGGKFTSENAYALDNLGTATVTGGELTSVNNSAIRFQIDSTNKDASSLKITGATLTSKAGVSDLSIYDKAINENVTDDYDVTLDANGNVVLKQITNEEETTTPTTTTQKVEENPKTSDNVLTSLILGSISLVGAFGCAMLIKKKINA